jgi:hydrogenase nickel incorporation protein HypA/HybF
MHELSVTEEILGIVLRHAAKSGVTRIEKIFLEIGELSDLEEQWLSRYFGAVSRGTAAEDASLVVTRIPCRFLCADCGREFDLDLRSPDRAACPSCSGESIRMIRGDEYVVKSMEAR